MDELLSADAFGALLQQRLNEIPIVAVLARDGLDLRLEVAGRALASSADAFYAAYRSAPHKQAEIVDAYAQLIVEEAPRERALPPFAQLAPRVMPMLKRPDVLAQVRERKLPMLVWTSFLADLIITYVVDEARSLSYINEEQLEQWELGEQELHAQAVANLRQRTIEKAQVTTVGEGAQRLYIYSSLDGYDATRLLLPDLMQDWQRELPGQIVIGIPNRDFLIAFSDDDTGVLAAVARQVQLDTASREHGLTDQLFTIRNGRVEEYEW
jgi:uncharacterized protein YtpQ (UPF0354 family)